MTILATDLATRERRPLLWWLSASALTPSPGPRSSTWSQPVHVRVFRLTDWQQQRWL
jgi:hypothetical protein